MIPDNPLKGKLICVASAMANYSNQQLIELLTCYFGARVSSIVTTRVDYLLIGDALNQTFLNKANSLNIPLLKESDLLDLIEDYL